MKKSLLEKLRYQLLLRPLGRGNPWSAERWESVYAAAGGTDYVNALAQLGHYAVLAGYVRHLAAGLPTPPCILDAGSGPGKLATLFASVPFARYVGFDLSETAVATGNALGVPNAEFRVASFDGFDTPERFDVIVFCESLYYADRPEETLRRFLSFLSPDGVALVSMYEKSASAARWRRLARVATTRDATRVTNAAGESWSVRLLAPLT